MKAKKFPLLETDENNLDATLERGLLRIVVRVFLLIVFVISGIVAVVIL